MSSKSVNLKHLVSVRLHSSKAEGFSGDSAQLTVRMNWFPRAVLLRNKKKGGGGGGEEGERISERRAERWKMLKTNQQEKEEDE